MGIVLTDLDKLKNKPNTPKFVDFQVLAIRRREYESDHFLFLELVDPKTKIFLCNAYIYPMEWYPNRIKESNFSHYHNVLRYCFAGLESEGRAPELLLQILKALWKPEKKSESVSEVGDGQLIILKFIISPDYNITGAELELAFNCPAKYFYESFLELQRTIREPPLSIGYVRGNAIHKGIQYASNEWVRSYDHLKATDAYHRAIIDEWRDNFEILLRKKYFRGPSKDLKLPIQVDSIVVDHITRQYKDVKEDELLNESLLFSPERGISGRADQIIYRVKEEELWEIKTGSRFLIESDYDPLSRVTHPVGLQAFAYREIIKKLLGRAPKTFIQFFDADAELDENNPEIIPLEKHAVIKRRKIDLKSSNNDQYLDLLLQTRNIAFAIESGLLSGYDRYKINKFLSKRYMPALGTDFNLLSSNWHRICNYCPTNQLGICSDGKRLFDPDIWLHFSQGLYEYWAWYFRQLKFELNAMKRHLYQLATIEIEKLEDQGITLSNLKKVKFDPYRYILTLQSSNRIFTRIREGDEVFVTPTNMKPGEIFSMEGTVSTLGSNEIIIKTRSIMKGKTGFSNYFRVDQVENVAFSEWQSKSLTDFLFESMKRSAILGRKISDEELPYTTKLLLGLAKPHKIMPVERKILLKELDNCKVDAIEKALGLKPGDILLIQGPPGSGKTRLIAQLAKEIFSNNYLLRSELIDDEVSDLPKPVLILTNTHRAADEVITKLSAFEELKPFVIRLESFSKEHPEDVKNFIIPNKVQFEDNFNGKADADILLNILEKGQEIYQQAGIIVGTLGSVANNLLKGLSFQWIIVDEAAQATEPATLGAFRHICPSTESKEGYPRVVLVGDHKQLPPVVSEKALEFTPTVPKILLNAGLTTNDSLKTSLFERLYRMWLGNSENIVILSKQYRMHEAISRIIKNAFYPTIDYIPANDKIGKRTLVNLLESQQNGLNLEIKYSDLLKSILNSSIPVIFINTEKDKTALEGVQQTDIQTESRFNIKEAKIVAKITAEFLKPYSLESQQTIAKEIGIISPYRYQNNLIYSELRATNLPNDVVNNIRVDTVDRFQGDEREIIIISLTNSNEANSIGQLHRDWRRVNVSISRARAKLIIIGNKKTFTKKGTDQKEKEAKTIFTKVFETIDELKNENVALELTSEQIII